MADTDISAILGSLSESDIENLKRTAQSIFGNAGETTASLPQKTGDAADFGELFKTGLPDMSVITKLSPVISELTKPDERADFIAALKPMLKPQRQQKADEAVRLLKLLSLIPILKNKGLL